LQHLSQLQPQTKILFIAIAALNPEPSRPFI
jgi:hypothetical protein